MRFRYSINSKWTKQEIFDAIEAIEWASNFYALDAGVTTIKFICSDLDHDAGTADKVKAGRYELRVNKQGQEWDEVIRTIMHEMTHIKQFLFDNLNLKDKTFKGKEYKDIDYWFAPWEMEARAMEEPLFQMYREEIG